MSSRLLGVASRKAELVVEVVLQRLRPRRPCSPWRRASCRISSSMRLLDGRCSSLKWSAQSSLMATRRSKSCSLSPFSSMTSSRSGSSAFDGVLGRLRRRRRPRPRPSTASSGSCFLQFEDRVFLQFLLDAFLQGHDRQLQDLHRLDHARSQNHLLWLHPLRDILVSSRMN